MAGYASSNNLSYGGFQNAYKGGNDAILVKFDSSGARKWATYYGGTGEDIANACQTDTYGNVFLAGQTISTSGVAADGFKNSYGGGNNDGFIAKFDANGNVIGEATWEGYRKISLMELAMQTIIFT